MERQREGISEGRCHKQELLINTLNHRTPSEIVLSSYANQSSWRSAVPARGGIRAIRSDEGPFGSIASILACREHVRLGRSISCGVTLCFRHERLRGRNPARFGTDAMAGCCRAGSKKRFCKFSS